MTFGDQQQEKKSSACPFLRQRAPHERVCTVHASRPELCRSYLCSRILILGKNGKKAGRVPDGTRSFTTEDGTLLDLWCHAIRDIPVPDYGQWEKNREEVFTRAGYRVIRLLKDFLLWRDHSKNSDARGDASSTKDEAAGLLKNSLLSNLIRDETGGEPSGSST